MERNREGAERREGADLTTPSELQRKEAEADSGQRSPVSIMLTRSEWDFYTD